MTGKRKRNDTPTITPHDKQGTTIAPRPQKRLKKHSTAAGDVYYTTAQIRTFIDGVSNITDWTSVNVITKHVQVIQWFDVQGLSKEACAKRYPNKQGQPCSVTNIFKVYNTYAPRFYAEKGLVYVPLGKRGAAKARVEKVVKRKKEGVKRGVSNPLDGRLKELFQAIPAPERRLVNKISDQGPSAPCSYHSASNSSGDTRHTDEDTVTFLCKTSSIKYGPPSGLKISRASLLRHCSTIRQSLLKNPRIHTITHGPEISLDTISCFAACIDPTTQPTLPTHVTTPYGTFEQEWSMVELEDLYVLAVTLGASSVCDLVIDRWIEDLRRAEPRVVVDEFGEAGHVDVLGFGPELLTFLWVNDKKGFAFLANMFISCGVKGYNRMEETHLANWHDGVKKALIKTIENRSVIDLFSAPRASICAAFHHHSPEDFTSLPTPLPTLRPKTTAPPKTPARPTLNTRPRYDDTDKKSPNTLRLTIPRFPHVHNKHPRISPADIDPIYALAERGTDRLRDHRNSHLDRRIQYLNPSFNAHHDTEEVCREKLRICREKVALFGREGIVISDEEAKKVLDGQGGDWQEDDEDGGREMDGVEEESEEEFVDV